jgi:hypothetical protein
MHRVFSATVGVFIALSVLDVVAQQPARLGASKAAPASKTSAPRSVSADVPRSTPGLLPGTKSNVFTTIQGNALTSTNGVLPDGTVRLRDVRFGRIVATTITDKSGLFEFRGIEPGSYVVELLGNDLTILATSQILSIDAGQALSAVVKLPFRAAPFGGIFGHTAASAAVVASAAAASGVLAVKISNVVSPPCDPPCH